MSGIAGFYRLDGHSPADGAIQRMLEKLRRRGPDRQRAWLEGPVAVGQALLATTPEALVELQPWTHPSSGCVVVSDSRLDNRPELLRELGLGHRKPDETGDGELFHAAWQRWGTGCAERLLGDFAVAIWDSRREQLFCARDIMGVRPLYYHFSSHRLFAFASQTQALLELSDIPDAIDEGRIADSIVSELEGIDNTCTFYPALKRLPPAHTLLVSRSGLQLNRYWHPLEHRPSGLPRTEDDWIEAIRETLRKAVERRLRSQRRVGSMLSGGLDSSSVAALGSELLRACGGVRLPTYSAIDSGRPCAETHAIHAVLSAIDAESATIDLAVPERFVVAQGAHWLELDEPFDGAQTLIASIYHRAAEQGVRSVMDGVPADNLYTVNGHLRLLVLNGFWRQAFQHSLSQHRSAQNLLPKLRALKSTLAERMPDAYVSWRDARGRNKRYRRNILATSLIDREFAKRVSLRRRYQIYCDEMESNVCRDAGQQALTSVTSAYITAAVERYNRTASYFGVEPRHPFLDREMIEFHAWLPECIRDRVGWPKWGFRMAMQGSLPEEVVWRRGKEHLGWRFNRAVMLSMPEAAVEQALSSIRGEYIDTRQVGSAGVANSEVAGMPGLNALLPAVLTGLWLRKHAKGAH